MIVGRVQFLADCYSESRFCAVYWHWACLRSLPQGPLQHGSTQAAKSKIEDPIFQPNHHFCCILLVRSKSLSLVHTKSSPVIMTQTPGSMNPWSLLCVSALNLRYLWILLGMSVFSCSFALWSWEVLFFCEILVSICWWHLLLLPGTGHFTKI